MIQVVHQHIYIGEVLRKRVGALSGRRKKYLMALRDDYHIDLTDIGPMAFLHVASVVTTLVVLTLSLQCAGMAALIYWVRAQFTRGLYRLGLWRSGMLIVRFTSIIIVLHGLQILLWACFYRWRCFSSWESALYFSTASYSTVGSGDLLLPRTWRILGAVESGTGVLMGGLSVAFVFAVITRLVEREARFYPELTWIAGQEASAADVWERRAFGLKQEVEKGRQRNTE